MCGRFVAERNVTMRHMTARPFDDATNCLRASLRCLQGRQTAAHRTAGLGNVPQDPVESSHSFRQAPLGGCRDPEDLTLSTRAFSL